MRPSHFGLKVGTIAQIRMAETRLARPKKEPKIVEYEKGRSYTVPFDIPHWLANGFCAAGSAYIVWQNNKKRNKK